MVQNHLAQRAYGLAALAADLSVVDFNVVMRQLNALPQSAQASTTMITQATRALDQADQVASGAAAGQGEQRKRDTVRAHLDFYKDASDDTLTAGFFDIRDWTIQAFVLYNAAVEVSQQALFWPSVLDALQEAPGLIGRVIGQVAGGAASGAASAAGNAILGFISGLTQSPLGLVVLAGAGYYAYTRFSK